MKKFLSVMLVICIVCSTLVMASCGAKEKTAKELVETACKKIENANAFDADINYDIEMSVAGMTVNMPIVANIKSQNINTESPVSNVEMSMELMGQKMDVNVYMENGWAYYDMLGMQYKANISEEELNYADMVDSLVSQSDFSFLEGVEVIKNSDGTSTVEVELDEELANKIGLAASSVAASMAGASNDVKITAIKYSYIVDKDENLVNLTMDCSMNLVVEGMAAEAEMRATLKFNAFGNDVVVTAPAGYLDYMVMDVG